MVAGLRFCLNEDDALLKVQCVLSLAIVGSTEGPSWIRPVTPSKNERKEYSGLRQLG